MLLPKNMFTDLIMHIELEGTDTESDLFSLKVMYVQSRMLLSVVLSILGIIHVFSCINICRGSRKLFEPEATRLRV